MTTLDAARARRLVPGDVAPALVTLATAGILAGTAAAGHLALGIALFVTQAVVVLAWLALADVDGALGASVIGAGAAVGSNMLAVRHDGDGISSAVGVLAGAFVLSLALQLARSHRQRTTDALAGTMTAVVLVVLAAHLLSASARTGWAVAATGVLCAGAAVVAGRVGDVVAVRPALVHGARRGYLGLLAGLMAAAVLGSVLGGAWAPLSARSGVVVGVVAALAAIATDLALDLAHTDASDERRLGALRPLGVLLPLVVAAPVTYAAARLLVG